ncbi:MAG: hypothetical protein ACXWWO_02045 [Candidatus Limnocylindria bacterium]
MIASKAIDEAFFISVPVRAFGPVNGPEMPMLIVVGAGVVVQPVAPEAAGAEEPAAAVAGACDAGLDVAPAPAQAVTTRAMEAMKATRRWISRIMSILLFLATSGGRIACAVGCVAL